MHDEHTIFDELEVAHVMLVNGIITTNFGWNSDDDEEDWCLSIYGNDDDHSNFEYYLSKSDLRSFESRGKAWILEDKQYGTVKVEFCLLSPAIRAI
jgi:hypothetical protein